MKLELNVSLDATLGCGQAHRWRRNDDGSWEGFIKDSVAVIRSIEGGIDFQGVCTADIKEYFRSEDDLAEITRSISVNDPYMASLASKCPGLRILKQPEWECLATYLLATNANVKRIAKMVESVCNLCGSGAGQRKFFPTPKQILDKKEQISECRLGFREERFIKLAELTERGQIDFGALSEMTYPALVKSLQEIDGVGPKVADCVALFGFGKLESFPVDVRIQHCMEKVYGIKGSYKTVSEFGKSHFGTYAGYAQELLYYSEFIR